MTVFRIDKNRKANELSGRSALTPKKRSKGKPDRVHKRKEVEKTEVSNEELVERMESMLAEQKAQLMDELSKNKKEFLASMKPKPTTRKKKEDNES